MQESPILGQTLTLTSQSTNLAIDNTTPSSVCTSTPASVDQLFSSITPISSSSSSSSSITLSAQSTTTTTTTYGSLLTNIKVPVKRGHKEHVASACTNCKKAHLACDVSRPCKRCVSLGKTDTCLDIKHKKRGRPKLQDKKAATAAATTAPVTNKYKVICGTIQTPNITNDNKETTISSFTCSPYPTQTSFHHQPIESFHKSYQQGNNDPKVTPDILTPIVLTPSSPAPSMTRSDSTLTIIEPQDTSNNNTYVSIPASPSTTTTTTTMAVAKVVLILSMEICCAKISNDVIQAWGYYPQELAHRSIYDFIAPEDSTRLSQLHRSLLDNVMEATSQKNPSDPPPTERTTSDLFHQKNTDELAIKATGFRSFGDTLHVKTRSGTKELYDMCLYIGGGWGANFDDVSTLTKLYIVMTCQKADLQPKPPPRPRSITTAYKPIAPLLSPATTPQHTLTTQRPLDRYAVYRNRPIQPAPHDLRRVTLPAHFANNSKLNTISFRNCLDSPKINIAPMTNSQQSSSSSSSSSTPCIYFQPTTAATTTTPQPTTCLNNYHPPPQRPLRHRQKSFSTITYRYTPPTGPRETPAVTHPTTQYFLQTSSATLNAAASAAQDHSRSTHPAKGSEITPSSRKQGISIRSLLC